MNWLQTTFNFINECLNKWARSNRRLKNHGSKRSTESSYEQLEQRQVMNASLPSFAPDAGVLYQIHGVTGEQGQLSEIDLANETFVDVGENAGFKINGTGFRTADGYVYGVKMDTDEIIRLGADGNYEVLGKVSGLPDGSFYTGDFGQDGLLYLRHQNNYYGVNVDSLTVEKVKTASESVTRTYDIAYNPVTELHYSIRKSGSKAEFISIDLRGDSTTAAVTVINDNLRPAGTFGAVFSDASGRVFAANNAGGLYEVESETGIATFAGQSPRASSNDGAVSSQAYLDLPPVAENAWMSVLAGEPAQQMPIQAPYDLEGQSLQVTVTELPEIGQVRTADGNMVTTGQALTVDELVNLTYQPTDQVDTDREPVAFHYEVSDGNHIVSAKVEIGFAGLSRLTGQVVVVDDTEESSYAGYMYNNEIRITGTDFRGNSVDETVLTDVDGNYRFENLAPGTYAIEQDQPDVVFEAGVDRGDTTGDVQGNRVHEIVIGAAPGSIAGPTFYEYAPTLISGFVYVDANGDGTLDVEEDGLADVVIELSGTDFDGNQVSLTTTTNIYGFYEFRGLAPGSYSVMQSQPSDFVSGASNVGDFGGVVSDNLFANVTLGPGEQATSYNFGEFEKSSLSGSVFIDNDLDKNFDQGDTALQGATVKLEGTDFRGNQVSLETRSGADGNYLFDDLVAGNYSLTQVQPEGLTDGYSHVGIFNNDEAVLASNGVSSTNQISGIEIGVGRHGRSYNFSEKVEYNFAGSFDQTLMFEGTDSTDEFTFTAGELFHVVNLNGEEFLIDASIKSNILFNGKLGQDFVSFTGSEKVERVVTSETEATMRSEFWRVRGFNSEHFTVDSGGGYDRAFMYDTQVDDRIKMTQDYARMWNDDGYYAETRGFHRTYAYSDNGGKDRAYLYDSKYDDTVKMTSENARMIGRKFYNFAGRFERVYAYSTNGGNDRAQFWDSALDRDVFQALPEYSRMYNQDQSFYNFAEGFKQVDAFGFRGGDNDRAYLYGSTGDEILIGSPAKTGMVGDGFAFDVHGFERKYAVSNGGNDRALLFDSKLDDRFVARPDDTRLFNNRYFLNAKGFAEVDAYSSSGGNDRAYFYDSEGDDTLVSLENEMRIIGNGFDNTSHGFARNYAHSTAGGNDTAVLYDTEHADTVKLGENVSKMYGETYYSWLNQFENVSTEFTNASRHDRALVFGAVDADTLAASGELADLIYDHAAEFIYDVEANESGQDGEDSDFASLYEDLLNLSTG